MMVKSSQEEGAQVDDGFLVIAEITRCHVFTKEVNHASTPS